MADSRMVAVRCPSWLLDVLSALAERNERSLSGEIRAGLLAHVYAAADAPEEPQNDDHPGELAAGPGDRNHNPLKEAAHAP